MEQALAEREVRRWAGEALWEGFQAASRTVEVTTSEGTSFLATGHARTELAFEVSLRPEQLRRFRLQMERDRVVWKGVPPWTEPSQLLPQTLIQQRLSPGQQPLVELGPQLLLAGADDRRPVLPEPLSLATVARPPALEERLFFSRFLRDEGANPNSLSSQHWGVIAPRGSAGDALLEAIRPLIDLRANEQGAPVHVYRVTTSGGIAEANDWMRNEYYSEGASDVDRPSYLLILGDLADVSAELQQRLGASAFVGRLCFDSTAGYRSYVEKVLRSENAPSKRDARALFFTTHDGSRATSIGYHSLIIPALERCDGLKHDYPVVRDVLEVGSPEDWSAQRLLAAVRDDHPSILFTLSHGLGPPRGGWASSEMRRLLQGALAFGPEEPLTAECVAQGPFLPSGAWFFLACLSAGTPARSAYRPWLVRLKASGEYAGRVADVVSALPAHGEAPFIAALPRAALSNPEGPLAIIGHLDLAWTYSFQDPYGARRSQRFVELIRQLWTGRRVGVATKALLRHAAETEAELLGLAQIEVEVGEREPPPPEAVHRGHLWMARHDLVGYVLLGDPAVRVAPARD